MRLKNMSSLLFAFVFASSALASHANAPAPVPVSPGPDQLLSYVNLKVWLEGPFQAGTMATNLNPNDLPLSQPYADASFDGTPMDYNGTEFVADWSGALAGVVDWVLVEVRTSTAAASKIATRAGLLMSDGSIRDTDGTSNLIFTGFATGDYFVVVRHRNHIPIMSNGVVTFSGTSPAPLYDLTVEANIYSGVGTNGAKNLGAGAFGLYAGDADASGGTGSPDNAAWRADDGLSGYRDGDFNLSGGTGAPDKAMWLGNPGKVTLVPEN
jgi:hypothetical protein